MKDKIENALEGMADEEVYHLFFDWYGIFARDNQQIPQENYLIWLILAGRGWV